MTKKRFTSFDVAREAGVSRTTVSFVLNDVQNQSIPEKTRVAVIEAARKLGYTPSAAAKALRAGRSSLVLVLGPASQPSELMDAGMSELTHRLRAAGYATVIAMSASEVESLDVLWQAVSPAAVVSMFDMPAAVRAKLDAIHVPVVDALFHTAASMPGDFELQVDVGRQQARHLLAHGAQRLVYARPPAGLVDADIVGDRSRGVREVAALEGVALEEVTEVRGEPGVDWIAGILARPGRAGVAGYNDIAAFAVLRAAASAGLHAPADFGVIGVDDMPTAEFASPPLSSVRFDIVAHIGMIAERVIRLLEGGEPVAVDPSPMSYVVERESS